MEQKNIHIEKLNRNIEETKDKFKKASFVSRTLSGAIYVAIVLSSIYFSSISYFFFIAFCSFVCLYEILKMIQLKSVFLKVTAYVLNSFILVIASEKYVKLLISSQSEINLIVEYSQMFLKIISKLYIIILPIFFIAFASQIFSRREKKMEDLSKFAFPFLYITTAFVTALLVPFSINQYSYSYQIIFGTVILIGINDTFAYLFGVRFGKHKLADRISPKKTIEGLIGGGVTTILASFIFAYFYPVPNIMTWIILSVIICITGVFGDLFESVLKRSAGVKDSGNIMPGHGGLLDRLDSFIFAIPFIYAYLSLIN